MMENNDKKILVYSPGTRKGDLDDDYTLYENGEILHFYDQNKYPGGYNLKRTLKVNEIDKSLKNRLYKATSEENKELVGKILGITN